MLSVYTTRFVRVFGVLPSRGFRGEEPSSAMCRWEHEGRHVLLFFFRKSDLAIEAPVIYMRKRCCFKRKERATEEETSSPSKSDWGGGFLKCSAPKPWVSIVRSGHPWLGWLVIPPFSLGKPSYVSRGCSKCWNHQPPIDGVVGHLNLRIHEVFNFQRGSRWNWWHLSVMFAVVKLIQVLTQTEAIYIYMCHDALW